ncbi:MAG: hypothetical protein EZS28_012785 [Streblomastix strix]|uniref:Glutamyl/glutaminyl-tRNA synthetase class Ib catalytic domain-containing protein n=1 Tax=Streblomastix strix TaxID=222440 RepID=A0A5J4W9Y2_9EUKA|nr:MAG: hypothetical protein EZS28_012785 [Streblomastix strix]
MKSQNTTLRYPVIFRCKLDAHPRTGYKYKAHPSYDFACPIIDSKEEDNVTLRTTEYRDRICQCQYQVNTLKQLLTMVELKETQIIILFRKAMWFD